MEANQVDGMPTVAPEIATGKSKMSKGQIIGMVILAVVALAGVAFGVWGIVGKNEAEKEKDLAIKITETSGKVTDIITDKITSVDENGTVTEITDVNSTYKNPIIQSKNSEKVYYVDFESSYIFGTSGTKRIEISLEDGKVSGCAIFEQQGDGGWKNVGLCNINGLEGNIYKVVEFGAGHSNEGSMIGFIMEDGRVAYFRLYDFDASSSVDATRYLKIDKIVTDALRVNVSENVGGYGSTIFVMSDGSFVEYNESMLE